MVSLDNFLIQLFQPYFFYSLVFLSIAFVSVKVFLKFNSHLSRKGQSLLWVLPLFIPVIVLLCFHPQTLITLTPTLPNQFSQVTDVGVMLLGSDIFSFTGLLCIGGALAAVGYLVLMLGFGRTIALKRFHVVMMAQDEFVSIQKEVKRMSRKLDIAEPKVGLVDDLLPNAFTLGYGRNTVVVFSLGLLELLEPDELKAVVSHELAHIKAKDFLFRALSYSLNLLSFFNPLSYFAASQAQKERELLADEKSLTLLDKPTLMQQVLSKLEALAPSQSKISIADRFSSKLFIVSPLVRRPGILATHPKFSQRMQNITAVTSKQVKKTKNLLPTLLLLSILFCVIIISGHSAVQIEQTVIQNQNAHLINQYQVLLYNSTVTGNTDPEMGILFPNWESFLNFTSGQQGMYRFAGT
jgi:Zn-dependent protease with chaperone function